jgi:hypothetical protein
MNYNFEIAMSALLSAQVVREMVTKEVEAQTGKRVTEIAAQYDRGEFVGFQVFFAPESKMRKPVSSKEFIKMKFDGE